MQGDVKRLHKSALKYREVVDTVIAKMFAKKYPHGVESVSIHELLRWQYWPIFITIYSKSQWKLRCSETFYYQPLVVLWGILD